MLKRKLLFDIYMKQTFYLKQTLLKQKWSEISHRLWDVLSFFVRVFIYLVILYQAVGSVVFFMILILGGHILWEYGIGLRLILLLRWFHSFFFVKSFLLNASVGNSAIATEKYLVCEIPRAYSEENVYMVPHRLGGVRSFVCFWHR